MENPLNKISIATLIDYTFGELHETELQSIEKIVLKDDYYFELVQNIMSYCEKHSIHNKTDLEKAIESDRNQLFDKIKEIEKQEPFPDPSTVILEKQIDHSTETKQLPSENYILLLIILLSLLALMAIVYELFKHKEEVFPDTTPPVSTDSFPPPTDNNQAIPIDSILLPLDSIERIPERKKDSPILEKKEKIPKVKEETKPKKILYAQAEIKNLSDQYLEAYPLDDDTKSLDLNEVKILYAEEAYDQVIIKLAPFVDSLESSKKDEYSLVLANSYLFSNDLTKAINILKNVDQVNPLFKAEYQWYLAHAYLRQGKKVEGMAILKALVDDDENPKAFPFLRELIAILN